ncbi:MAG: glutathione S-transferase N-terminal domain-containing protein [Acinetobacter harbinensis]|uniref:glutathione S-transferase N-terminal domain-containing protein n=1 Tax=Acinetobacter sp. TaxID=472 RepID=UPI00257F5344|nr:glutathione S-transferase N-terminal domain-containing protein [Acinetobacter sp.]MDD2940377.1 glutathione S-transferase N-terminal domain-containing protein [Acinetobacter harbinensis]
MNHQIKVIQALASSLLEGGRGMQGTAFPQQPEKPLQLYEFEGSPFCRRVREVLTLLNLDYEVYPCPKGGQKYRKIVQEKGGKQQFPFLVDENSGVALYESQDIIHYLFQHYGKTGKTPQKFAHYPQLPVVALAGTLVNGARGIWINKKIIDRAAPAELLELWGFEASPFTRVVRATLAELELPFIYHNVAKERWQDMGPAVLRFKPGKYQALAGGKREKVMNVMGRDIQVPYLVDPNTGVKMFESAAIVKYLNKHYG